MSDTKLMDYDEYRYECGCILEEEEGRSDEEVIAFWPECPDHNEPIKPEVQADMARSLGLL